MGRGGGLLGLSGVIDEGGDDIRELFGEDLKLDGAGRFLNLGDELGDF